MPKTGNNRQEKVTGQDLQETRQQSGVPLEVKLVRVKDLQKMSFCPFGEATLAALRKAGTGPKFLQINKRIFYDLADFRTWVNNNLRNGQAIS